MVQARSCTEHNTACHSHVCRSLLWEQWGQTDGDLRALGEHIPTLSTSPPLGPSRKLSALGHSSPDKHSHLMHPTYLCLLHFHKHLDKFPGSTPISMRLHGDQFTVFPCTMFAPPPPALTCPVFYLNISVMQVIPEGCYVRQTQVWETVANQFKSGWGPMADNRFFYHMTQYHMLGVWGGSNS